MTRSILFILEKNTAKGKAYLGSSNDLFLISRALEKGFEVYITTPEEILSNKENFSKYPALKLSNSNQELVNREIKSVLKQEVIRAILCMRPDNFSNGTILLKDAKSENINLYKSLILNRSEPISLSNDFYETLISIKENGGRILPDPYINYYLGDKAIVHAIHNNLPIKNIDLGIDKASKISFESKFIKISKNLLNSKQIRQFYDFLMAENFDQAKENFPEEYEIFTNGIKEYLEFHKELANDSIIKPAAYFGGTGIVVAQNQILDFNLATRNVCQSFLAILEDCKKTNHEELAFLSEIIVQQRANLANLGDLRIVISNGNLQGIFTRVNSNFEKTKANNLHFGGHPESLFKHYPISKEGVDQMINDMKEDFEEVKKSQSLYDLLEKIEFVRKIKILESHPIIGVDALLTKDDKENYRYGINEINLTSPMGQVQLIILEIAVKLNAKVLDILDREGIKIKIKKYQILADFFKNCDEQTILNAKLLMQNNQEFGDLVAEEIDKILDHNIADETLSAL